ncbi:GH19811 [Drosophila grimshawi]|uniref:GH19811 n=1 Tax=Drosophila grimshawi TaxID=7222 RepID=B4JA01_DROGR|nr:GH19811 [Drosophila grimshawi]
METCGFILSRAGEFESLLMRCSYCPLDIEIEKWQEFVLHFQNTHALSSKDNSSFLDIEEIAVEENVAKNEYLTVPIEEENTDLKELSEVDMSRISSSLSDSSLGENQTAETDYNTQSADDADQEPASYSPNYKFNPSFFRRDPRTLHFIESYKSQPCLWNPVCSKYKDSAACKAAYAQLIAELKTQIHVSFSEHTLKAAIKKLHMQYNLVERRLNFLKRNKITTDFVQLYANFPQLYDSKHKEFSSMISRKQAYEAMTAQSLVPHGRAIRCDDVYLAVQCLRQWYYKSTKSNLKTGNESEQFYLKACAFLPHKMFKQKLICELCQQETSSDHVLQAHMCKVHNIGELPFKCTSCDRSFVGRGDLATHMQRVHIGKTHKCNYCERSFAVNSDLRLHIRTHTGNSILCELCGKAFRLRSQLKLHVTAIHTKIRAFKCTMCPKDFLKKVDLSDHIKSHLNIRDKICTTCGKGFTSCHSLIRHRQIHAEVKKFVCKLCEARFSQFVGLNSHMKRTHNIVRNNVQKTTEHLVPEQTIS